MEVTSKASRYITLLDNNWRLIDPQHAIRRFALIHRYLQHPETGALKINENSSLSCDTSVSDLLDHKASLSGHLIYMGRNSWNRTMNGKHISLQQPDHIFLFCVTFGHSFCTKIAIFLVATSSSPFREFVQGIVSRRSERMTLAAIQCLPHHHPVHPPSDPPR